MSSNEFEFEHIHETFRLKIHRYLVRMVGECDAEDLTQEVFVKINQALKNFRGESELSTWIYRIATNAAIDLLRSPSFKKTIQNCAADSATADGESDLDDRNTWTEEKAPPVEQQVYRQEMNDCVSNYINNLPEAYRTVVVLSEFEDLSNKAIAEILGITLDTVKIRLHRAREKLKEKLAASCGSEWIEGNEFVPELKRSDLEFLKRI